MLLRTQVVSFLRSTVAPEQDPHQAEMARLERELEAERRAAQRWRRVAEDRRVALERLQNRWPVRALLTIADVILPVLRRWRWRSRSGYGRVSARVRQGLVVERPEGHDEHVRNAMASARTPPRDQRSITAIVLVRDNRHLPSLIRALRATRHEHLDIVIVDAAAGDPVRHSEYEGVRVVGGGVDRSVAAVRNEVAEEADSDALLFLDGNVHPLDTDWLDRMMEQLDRDVVAVGAQLVSSPQRVFGVWHRRAQVVHLGYRLRPASDGPPQPVRISGGDPDPTGVGHEVMAASASCLLVDRTALVKAGGFDEGFQGDAADLDLCWRLRVAGGRIVVEPGAVLTHRTDAGADPHSLSSRPARAWDHLADRYGAAMRHAVDDDRLSAGLALSDVAFSVGITVASPGTTEDGGALEPPRSLGAALSDIGWNVRYLAQRSPISLGVSRALDAVIVFHTDFDVRRFAQSGMTTVAWVGNTAEGWLELPWLEDFDLVVAASPAVAETICGGSRWRNVPVVAAAGTLAGGHGSDDGAHPDGDDVMESTVLARQLRDVIRAHRARQSFVIRIGAPNRRAAARWGDTYFAEALVAEFRMAGHHAIVQTVDEWPDRRGKGFDVSLQLKGRARWPRTTGQLHAIWVISHPDEVDPSDLEDADVVFAASLPLAQRLRGESGTPTHVLLQATDHRRFRPTPRNSKYVHDVVFLGNSRSVERPAVRDALLAELPLTVYGTKWERFVPPQVIAAQFVPNDRVAAVYSSAKVVLNDHWPDMREWGLISNRLFDALACGACVVTDRVDGVEELFGDAVAVAEGPDEIGRVVRDLLADPQRRREMGERGREIVLAEHTFRHRVDDILAAIQAVGGGTGRAPTA